MNWSRIKKFLAKNWPPIFIFLVVVIFFWKFVFGGMLPIPADTIVGMYHPWRDVVWDNFTAGVPFKNFLITDPVRQQFPWRQLVIDAFKQKQLPLWNPYSFAGTPLLANFQSGAFYFLNSLFFILDSKLAWGILIFLQPLLAGIFLYFYLRHLKLQKIACLLGGLSFAFSGFFVAWLEWGTVLHSALWLPLILLAIEKIIKLKTPPRCPKDSSDGGGITISKWSLVFVFSLVQSFFAGHLQVFFYVFMFSFIYLVWRLFRFTSEEPDVSSANSADFTLSPSEVKNSRPKLAVLFLILYAFFFILSSFQWRPTLQLIKLSAREIDQAGWNQPGWFIPWQHLVQFLVPDFFGNPTTLNYWGVWNYGEFVGFIGVIPLLFVFWAVFKHRRRELFFFLILGAVALSFALPTPWAKAPYRWRLPFLSTSQPTRLLLLVDFCLAVLAAFGLDAFLRKKKKVKPLILLFVVYGALWLFVLLAARFWPAAGWLSQLAISQRNLILPTGMLIAGVFLIWLMAKVKKKFFSQAGLVCLFVLVIFDWLRFGWKFTPFVKKDWLFPSTKTIEFLQKDKNIFRLMSTDRRIMPPNFAAVYRLQSIDGYDPLFLLRYAELIAASERGEPNISPPFGFNRIVTPQNYQSRLIDLLNVKYVLSLTDLESEKLELVFQEGETRVYENKNVIPRAFMVYGYQVVENRQEAINLLMSEKANLRQKVVLEEQLAKQLIDGQNATDEVVIKNYQENRIVIETESNKKGILVLIDAYYPGWQATVDGEETKIYRADYHFRAIIVPEGEHQIVFKYGN